MNEEVDIVSCDSSLTSHLDSEVSFEEDIPELQLDNAVGGGGPNEGDTFIFNIPMLEQQDSGSRIGGCVNSTVGSSRWESESHAYSNESSRNLMNDRSISSVSRRPRQPQRLKSVKLQYRTSSSAGGDDPLSCCSLHSEPAKRLYKQASMSSFLQDGSNQSDPPKRPQRQKSVAVQRPGLERRRSIRMPKRKESTIQPIDIRERSSRPEYGKGQSFRMPRRRGGGCLHSSDPTKDDSNNSNWSIVVNSSPASAGRSITRMTTTSSSLARPEYRRGQSLRMPKRRESTYHNIETTTTDDVRSLSSKPLRMPNRTSTSEKNTHSEEPAGEDILENTDVVIPSETMTTPTKPEGSETNMTTPPTTTPEEGRPDSEVPLLPQQTQELSPQTATTTTTTQGRPESEETKEANEQSQEETTTESLGDCEFHEDEQSSNGDEVCENVTKTLERKRNDILDKCLGLVLGSDESTGASTDEEPGSSSNQVDISQELSEEGDDAIKQLQGGSKAGGVVSMRMPTRKATLKEMERLELLEGISLEQIDREALLRERTKAVRLPLRKKSCKIIESEMAVLHDESQQ